MIGEAHGNSARGVHDVHVRVAVDLGRIGHLAAVGREDRAAARSARTRQAVRIAAGPADDPDVAAEREGYLRLAETGLLQQEFRLGLAAESGGA